MKGGLACMLIALKAVLDSGEKFTGDIIFMAVVDEERGGQKGTKYVLEKGVVGDFSLIAEPSDLDVLIAFKGDLGYRLSVYGKTAHAANPERGINAIHKTINIINNLLQIPEKKEWSSKYHRLVGPPTIGISVIDGGIQRNIIPDLCTSVIDRRIVPGMDTIAEAKEEIESEIKKMMEGDPELKAKLDSFIEVEACEISQDEKIVQTLVKCYNNLLGSKPKITGVSYFTDAHYMINRYKIPTAIFGPGNISRAHTENEYVEIDQLINGSNIYAHTIMELLSR
jgi:acetylornithine deacetylase/succinyl-diaminopimelate desuccinylase-like protein